MIEANNEHFHAGMGVPVVFPSVQTVSYGDIVKFKCYFDEKVSWGPLWNSLYRIEHDEWEGAHKSRSIIFVADQQIKNTEKCEYHDSENRFKLYAFARLELRCIDDDMHYQISRSEGAEIYNSRKIEVLN